MNDSLVVGVSGVPEYWQEAKAHLRSVDSVLSNVIDAYDEPPLSSKGRLFETCVHSIVGQQISASAAHAVWKRFVDLVGDVTPERVQAYDTDTLRSVGLSGRKVEYILGLASQRTLLETTPWARLSDQDVMKALTQVRGGPLDRGNGAYLLSTEARYSSAG